MDITNVKKRLSQAQFSVPDQSFQIQCASLRPFTRFFCVFDKIDYTAFCVQDGKKLGDPLISDGYGKLNFTFYWNRQNEEAILSNPNFARIFKPLSGNKILTITDKSGTSYVTKTIFFTNNTPDIMFTKYTQASNIVTN